VIAIAYGASFSQSVKPLPFISQGSTYGRKLRAEELQKNPRAVQKDLNWLEMGKKLRLGPEKRARFRAQLEADIAVSFSNSGVLLMVLIPHTAFHQFLMQERLMDYSMLVGVHDTVRGNQDNIRDNTLAVFEPNTQAQNRRANASEVRKAVATSDPVALGPSSSKLPEAFPEE
jgi:1-phosphatidylinositol-4-phosphate 5-kinase